MNGKHLSVTARITPLQARFTQIHCPQVCPATGTPASTAQSYRHTIRGVLLVAGTTLPARVAVAAYVRGAITMTTATSMFAGLGGTTGQHIVLDSELVVLVCRTA
mmetsp:Transcript_136618/g.332142  ORF Transcript_136618/g.332142 Transcript_136618/m.332142 type:complete len:105 (+) Transcript_136618:416-730(+)